MNRLTVQNWVFCEQARPEVGGKHTLLGVSAPQIFAESFPTIIAVTLWVSGVPTGLGPFSANVRVQDHEGKTLITGTLTGEFQSSALTSMIIGPMPISLEHADDFAFSWNFGEEWEQIGVLSVGLQSNQYSLTSSSEPQKPV